MLKFILVASTVILFLVFSIPILIAERWIGKKDPEKKGRQSLAIVRFMFRLILKMAGIHITVKGMENIPEDTPVLYVGNHRSYFDILVGYTTVPTPLGFMAKKEMERIPLLSNWMRNVNCLFLDRENIREGLKAILDGVEKVKNGVSVWIFPEGTRNDAQDYLELMPFKEGSLKIAEKAGCPVVPVAITGTAEAFESHYPRITSSQVTIEFGEPFIIPGRTPRGTAKASADGDRGEGVQRDGGGVRLPGQAAQGNESGGAETQREDRPSGIPGKAALADRNAAAVDGRQQASVGKNPPGSVSRSDSYIQPPAQRPNIRHLTTEEKKFAGAHARDEIVGMLLKEKSLREGN